MSGQALRLRSTCRAPAANANVTCENCGRSIGRRAWVNVTCRRVRHATGGRGQGYWGWEYTRHFYCGSCCRSEERRWRYSRRERCVCGRELRVNPCGHVGARYCGDDCAREARRIRQRRQRTRKALTCENCGGAFEAWRSDARYCGSACRQKAYRRRTEGS